MEQKYTIYYLVNKKSILFKDIKTIKINDLNDLVEKSTFIVISNNLQLEDSEWMGKKPVEKVSIDGYRCGHTIFVHINSKKIDDIIGQIKLKQKEIKEIEINGENGDDIDGEVWKIVDNLKDQKAVIVSNCTD